MKRRLLVSSLAGLLLLLATITQTVAAHPLDVYVQASYITLTQENILVDVDLTPGVLISAQVLPLIDMNGDQAISEAEGLTYAKQVISALRLEANDKNIALTLVNVNYPPYLDLTAGTGVIQLHLTATLPASISGSHQLFYENAYEVPTVNSTYLVNGFVQKDAKTWIHITGQKRDWYQHTLLLDYTLGAESAQPSNAGTVTTGQSSDAASGVSPQQQAIIGFLHENSGSVGLLIAALIVSVILGGLHALTPGHGKTLIAAYLVGSRGTVKHAIALGGIVTLTHTLSVIIIGILALVASHFIVPELLVPMLEIGSGLLVVGLGARLIWKRWVEAHQQRPIAHSHSHQLPQTVRYSDLLVMGISGGVVPCPEALGILLVAIGLNKVVLGIGLIISFSLGLALVLIALGIALVRSKSLVSRLKIAPRIQQWLPLVSAALITMLGAGIVVKGITATPVNFSSSTVLIPLSITIAVAVIGIVILAVQRRGQLGLASVTTAPALPYSDLSILPPRYRNGAPVSNAPMGSAALKFDATGQIAWNEMWTDFCDLALAGGPPHRGTLLEPVKPEEIQADPEGYQRVLAELERGMRLVTGLEVVTDAAPGWIGLVCTDEAMAVWLLRAIIIENVSVRREGKMLFFPAGPQFRTEGEIKNVVTVIAKTNHYWQEHRLG